MQWKYITTGMPLRREIIISFSKEDEYFEWEAAFEECCLQLQNFPVDVKHITHVEVNRETGQFSGVTPELAQRLRQEKMKDDRRKSMRSSQMPYKTKAQKHLSEYWEGFGS